MSKEVQTTNNANKVTKKKQNSSSNSSISIIQLVFEVFVLVGYLIALIPFGYLLSLWFVIPLTLCNLILSIISNNNTQIFTIINSIMALLSLIPLLGYVFRVVGIVMSVLSISKLQETMNK